MSPLLLRPRSDHQHDNVRLRFVDHAVAIGHAGPEARDIARAEPRFALVLDQGHVAFEHVNEFVLVLVPVTHAGGGTGFEPDKANAELGQADGVAESLGLAPRHHLVERWWIVGARRDPDLVDVDLRHCYTRSMMVAVPMPAPMQSVISAVDLPVRSNSSSAVPRIMAPVAPSG